jgi:hypothetical protein
MANDEWRMANVGAIWRAGGEWGLVFGIGWGWERA